MPDRLLTEKEERRLTNQAAAGNREAREKLVKHNSRLVISIARRYQIKGIPFEDLVMAGFEGLLKGIDKFNPKLGYKLSTYVTWWIRQRVFKELDNHSTTIRLPGYMRSLRRQLVKLEKERGEKLTASEIRKTFEVTKQTAQMAKRPTKTRSLDADLTRTNTGSLKRLLKNPKAEEPPQSSLDERRSEKLREAMDVTLSDRERRIIKLYYGLDDYKPRTLEEVGEVFMISRERIRQLRDRALEKLKNVRELRAVNMGEKDL